MQGLMMGAPLLITSIMRHSRSYHGTREIVSVTADDARHRYTYADAFRRAAQLANALQHLGFSKSDRIATLAWNDHRHLELYYAVSCSGFVLHTINPRLYSEQITYIANHAEDRYLFVDPLVLPLVESIRDRLDTVRGFVVLTDDAHMSETSLPGAVSYEALIADQPETYDWPELDENDASSLCYTSGTTGEPKGVLYSHRSTVIHAYATSLPDALSLSARDALLPVVPMFHVNAWGTAYSAPLVGAKLILPGPKAGDPETLYELIETEQATAALGVPTVWLGLLHYLSSHSKKLTSLERAVVGGSACPPAIIEEFRQKHGVVTHHAWGMTETSPLGTINSAMPGIESLPESEQRRIEATQGRAIFGIELGIFDDDGAPLPWDGRQFGALKVRGPWVASSYYRAEPRDAGVDWFDTGDVATIDPNGFMQITDRTKDVIKSGGEWISSIELENIAVAHDAVAEAAVIGIAHPKWGERPLLLVVKKPDCDVDKDDVLAALRGNVADWWLPDAVEFVDALPHTATGKISKRRLREQFRDYEFANTR
jgi:acyl-CoA synthetase (AMP-forming)/AMP-acid ligase II